VTLISVRQHADRTQQLPRVGAGDLEAASTPGDYAGVTKGVFDEGCGRAAGASAGMVPLLGLHGATYLFSSPRGRDVDRPRAMIGRARVNRAASERRERDGEAIYAATSRRYCGWDPSPAG